MQKETAALHLVFKAVVIVPNERTRDFGSLVAIARHEAKKREKTSETPPILSLRFFPELGIYVAVYEAKELQKPEVKRQSG